MRPLTRKSQRRVRFVLVVLVAAVFAVLATERAAAAPSKQASCVSEECKKRVAKKRAIHKIYPFCNTWKCVKRVTRKRLKREMRYYKKHPLPWCTWGPESGSHRPEWSMARYRQPNVSGGDGGGKFQIMLRTWANFGGTAYTQNPVDAAPVLQERVARRIANDGFFHWVNC